MREKRGVIKIHDRRVSRVLAPVYYDYLGYYYRDASTCANFCASRSYRADKPVNAARSCAHRERGTENHRRDLNSRRLREINFASDKTGQDWTDSNPVRKSLAATVQYAEEKGRDSIRTTLARAGRSPFAAG